MHELTAALAGAAAAATLTTYLWLRRPPPLLLARWMHPDIRRVAADALTRQNELRLRHCRSPLTLYLIRHGQSEANVAPHLIGGRDVRTPLTASGEAQAVQVGRRLAREGLIFDRVFASHAARARRTAELACAECGFPAAAIEVEPRLVEFSQGGLEGRLRQEAYAAGGPAMRGIRREAMFFRPSGLSPDGERGESQHDAEVRMRGWVEELQAAQAAPQTVAVFSHGVAIRSFVRGVLGADTRFTTHSETANCSITVLEYRPCDAPAHPADLGGWVLKCLNDQASPADWRASGSIIAM